MPHLEYEAARREAEREDDPLTFSLAGRTFTCVAAPRLGDTFELMDAPEPVGANEVQAVRALARFVRRVIVPEQRPEWDRVLFELGPEHGPLLIRIGTDLAEQYTGRPTVPSSGSAGGRPTSGSGSNSTVSAEDSGG